MKFAAKAARRILIPVALAGGIACAGAVSASAEVIPVLCTPDGQVVYYDTESGMYATVQEQ